MVDELELDAIDFYQASDYSDIIDGLLAGRIDAAQLGGFSYVIAADRGAEVLISGIISYGPDIEPVYRSYR